MQVYRQSHGSQNAYIYVTDSHEIVQIWRHAAWHMQCTVRQVPKPRGLWSTQLETSRNARCRTVSTLSSGLYLLARSLWWTTSRRAFMAPNWKVLPSDLRSPVLPDIGFAIGFPSARKINCSSHVKVLKGTVSQDGFGFWGHAWLTYY